MKTQQKGLTLSQSKGFTLLELLIVIAILAVLATVAVLVINPVEYLRQARDSQRMGDLRAVKGALDLYVTTATGTIDLSLGAPTTAYRCSNAATTTVFSQACTSDVTREVNGNGWVAVNFGLVQGGSPLTILPLDPTNSVTYQYAYAGVDATTAYELNARLESNKFREQMENDGGDKNTCTTFTEATCWYEVGSSLTL